MTVSIRRMSLGTGDYESVAELNFRARADRVAASEVKEACTKIARGGAAGIGDRVITRENNRGLSAGRSWVKNGDAWTVRAIGRDGTITVQRENGRSKVVLPAAYVRSHLELGYAATAYCAQGRTVDTAHALVSHTTTREVLYVSMTRGRNNNTIYVDTRTDPDVDTAHDTPERVSVEQELRGVLDARSPGRSAHTIIDDQVLDATVRHQQRYERMCGGTDLGFSWTVNAAVS
jgi:hypothetical protein